MTKKKSRIESNRRARTTKKKELVVYSHIRLSIRPLRLQSLQVSQAYFLQFLRHLSETLVKAVMKKMKK